MPVCYVKRFDFYINVTYNNNIIKNIKMLSKEEVKFLIEAIMQKPLNHNLGDAIAGIKVNEFVMELIAKLQSMLDVEGETKNE